MRQSRPLYSAHHPEHQGEQGHPELHGLQGRHGLGLPGCKDKARVYVNSLDVLEQRNPKAAAYLDAIPHETWTVYKAAQGGISLHGWRTTNFVESENNRLMPARLLSPLDFCDYVAMFWHQQKNEKFELASKWQKDGLILVKPIQNLWDKELADVSKYSVHMFAGTTTQAYVSGNCDRNYKRHYVDLEKKHCCCGHPGQFKFPCRHMAAVAQAQGQLRDSVTWFKTFFAPEYHVDNYLAGYQGPQVYLPDKHSLEADSDLRRPLRQAQKGRPQKMRIRSAGQTDNSGQAPKRCSNCREIGHNSARCTKPVYLSDSD